MIRFLHGADFHLDSAFGALPPGQAAARRRMGSSASGDSLPSRDGRGNGMAGQLSPACIRDTFAKPERRRTGMAEGSMQ